MRTAQAALSVQELVGMDLQRDLLHSRNKVLSLAKELENTQVSFDVCVYIYILECQKRSRGKELENPQVSSECICVKRDVCVCV